MSARGLLRDGASSPGRRLALQLAMKTHHHLEQNEHMLAKLTEAVETALLRDTTIGSLMTADVAKCTPDDTIERAAQLMWERACGCVAVVDEDDKPLAMLTDRDACMAAYTQGKRLWEIRVASAMSSRLFVTTTHEPLADAERRMRCHALHRLPVVDDEGRLVGILSFDDIARAAKIGSSPDRNPLSASAVAHTAAGVRHDAR